MAEDRINNEQLRRIAFKEEPRFLSILLKDKDSLMEAIAMGIKPGNDGHFWNLKARFLYKTIYEYYNKYNQVLTRTAMESVMDSTIDGIKVLGEVFENRAAARMYWDEVYALIVPVTDFKSLVEGINNRYVQWQALKIMQAKMEDLIKNTNNQNDIVKKLKEDFNSIDGLYSDPYSLTMDFNTGMDKSIQYIEEKREGIVQDDSVLSCIKAIDDIYCGFDCGSYTVITGMVNGGKTTLMFNLAFNMAKAGHYVIYVSLEKKAVPFYIRLLCLHSLIDYNRIKRGGKGSNGIDENTFEALKMSIRELKQRIKPYLTCIQMTQGTKLSKILAEVDRVKSTIMENDKSFKEQNKKIVFFLDYLGAVGNETVTPGRPDLDDAKTSQRVQAYGRENNFATFTAAQLKAPASKDIRNKAKKASAEDVSNVEVSTEDISGSKMIIADADAALGVILNNDQPPTKMFVCITKARDSESRRTVVVDFDGKLGRISDPLVEPGQVKDLNDILYNKELTEEKLRSEDGLFDSTSLNKAVDAFDPEPKNRAPVDVDNFVKEFKGENTGDLLSNKFIDESLFD